MSGELFFPPPPCVSCSSLFSFPSPCDLLPAAGPVCVSVPLSLFPPPPLRCAVFPPRFCTGPVVLPLRRAISAWSHTPSRPSRATPPPSGHPPPAFVFVQASPPLSHCDGPPLFFLSPSLVPSRLFFFCFFCLILFYLPSPYGLRRQAPGPFTSNSAKVAMQQHLTLHAGQTVFYGNRLDQRSCTWR